MIKVTCGTCGASVEIDQHVVEGQRAFPLPVTSDFPGRCVRTGVLTGPVSDQGFDCPDMDNAIAAELDRRRGNVAKVRL